MKDKKVVVFDLDDTLISEIDYLKSAYKEIALKVNPSDKYFADFLFEKYRKGENVFDYITENFSNYSIDNLLKIYREHYPQLELREGVLDLLSLLQQKSYTIGLITDGRSITQRNKLKATNIEVFFDEIIISEEFGSEKPSLKNYRYFEDLYPNHKYYYIGDNVNKDFVSPNKLGWTTFCILDPGKNIHKQDFKQDYIFLPKHKITDFYELKTLLSL